MEVAIVCCIFVFAKYNSTLMNLTVSIISKSEELPQIECRDFFHSTKMFRIAEKTPGFTPFMAIAQREDGTVAAHLLATIRRRGSWIPPYLFTQGRIYGEGEYDADVDKDEAFGLMLDAITAKFVRRLCLYVEFSNMSQKMFGYRHFRRNKYFPINWQEVHNSLHSAPPEERLADKMLQRIERTYANGVETREIKNEQELDGFYRLLKNFYRTKIRRFMPPKELFEELNKQGNARLFVTLYHGKIIGGSACVYSDANAYLWYMGSKRKSFPHLHPERMTLWHAIKYAYDQHYRHIYFIDVGLPYPKNQYREFILSFGGKPVAKYRWFRFTFPWINRLLSWFYRE